MEIIETFVDSNMSCTGRICIRTYLCLDRELAKTGRTSNPKYESMVFVADVGDKIRWVEEFDYKRYTDEQEAILGHAAMIAKWHTEPRDDNSGWESRLAIFQYVMARPYGR